MEKFILPLQIRWADIDANNHLRHSVYYDFGAQARIECLAKYGITMEKMQALKMGPVIFREECVFRKEVRAADQLTITVAVSKLRADFSRFSFRHEIVHSDGTICATLNLDGAWLDTQLRKLKIPPQEIADLMKDFPKTDDFVWV
jgi:acyl-CoA thioester hydrolase